MTDTVQPGGKPPTYCLTCGARLVERSTMQPQGYDAFTGKRKPGKPRVTRECERAPLSHGIWELVNSAKWEYYA